MFQFPLPPNEYRVGKLLLERELATEALTEAELPIVRGVQNAK